MRRLAIVFTAIFGVLALTVLAGGTVTTTATASAGKPPTHVRPLPQAHAHNDYEHPRPLFDALANGFTSVEADIFLVGGQLLVGHDPDDLTPERTLQRLYLDPLAERVRRHHGAVHRGYYRGFQLLVDIKATGEQTYAALDKVLRSPKYAFLFTRFRDGHVRPGAVTVVISGDRPRATMTAQRDRLAFYDGRIIDTTDLGPGADWRLAPLVSDNWTKLFSWDGVGEMPANERAKLLQIVRTAHKARQKVRFWATRDIPGAAREAVWSQLLDAGVDHLNTDDLAGLRAFLTERGAR